MIFQVETFCLHWNHPPREIAKNMPNQKSRFSWMAFFLGPLAFFNERLIPMGFFTTTIETFLMYVALYVRDGGTPSTVVWLTFHITLGFYQSWMEDMPPFLLRRSRLPRWACWMLGLALGVVAVFVCLWPMIREYILFFQSLGLM